MKTFAKLCLLSLSLPSLVAASPLYEGLLSVDSIGARAFRNNHSAGDGRGVVVAVLDTGVDVGDPGLRVTTTGAPKVIVTRDFSRQGRRTLAKPDRAIENGRAVLRTADGWVIGEAALSPPPKNPSELELAFFSESAARNSDVRDINANGRTDDTFAVVVYEAEAGLVAVVDRDGDHDLTGETAIRSFEVAQESFHLGGHDPKNASPPLTFTLYLDPAREFVELCFDDGGHGTHVAGIAVGHGLEGKPGYDGIAPGAQVLSLKIGNNALSGGASTSQSKRDALEFAAKWAKDHDTPVVMNLSYGIGSEIEGQSDIDEDVNRVLQENPRHLFLTTSCGNSGPGLSSAGQPAAAELAFTAGAALMRSNARVLYGADPGQELVFAFSSRGGDTAKPDAVLPGVAASSVPPFMDSSVMSGTSMAAPQAAGAHALLLSAGKSKGITFNNAVLRRALRNSARPLDGYTPADQGGGLVWLPDAWELAQELARTPEAGTVAGYVVRTESPSSPSGSSPSVYWRAGRYVPTAARPQTLSITPLFSGSPTAAEKERFFASYDVRTDASWVRLLTSSTTLRGDGSATVSLHLDPSLLDKPGLHVARIFGSPADGVGGRRGAAFEAFATVAVPRVFEESNRYTWKQERISLGPGEIRREFVQVPPGASALSATAQLVGTKPTSLWIYGFDPQGRRYRLNGSVADSRQSGKAAVSLSKPWLEPGVWELVYYCPFREPGPAVFDAEVRFFGLDTTGLEAFTIPQGQSPSGLLTVTNRFAEPFFGRAAGELDGYGRKLTVESETDTIRHAFSVDAEVREVRFSLAMAPEDYVRFTDVAVTVLDAQGNAVHKDGFGQARTVTSFVPTSTGNFTLELRGAFARASEDPYSVELVERFITRDALGVSVTGPQGAALALYPQVTVHLDAAFSGRPRQPPEGFQHTGEVRFYHDRDSAIWLTQPLAIDPQ